MLAQHLATLKIRTPGRGLLEIVSVQLSIPLLQGRLALGTWQGIYLWEHRVRGHAREIVLHVSGDKRA